MCIELKIIFLSITEAAKYFNLKSSSSIGQAIIKGGLAVNYHWRYATEEDMNNESYEVIKREK